MPAKPTKHAPEIADIARKHLGFETLDTRGSDALDFRDVAVWCVRDALEAAYAAGMAAAAKKPSRTR
jgi:hypothetical protein